MPKWLQAIMDFFRGASGSKPQVAQEPVPSSENTATHKQSEGPQNRPKENTDSPAPPPTPSYPSLNPEGYAVRLKKTVKKKGPFPQGYESIADDPTTAENERRTFCNFFLREVCSWFGWKNFESPNRDQAGEITMYMRNHPETWEKLSSHEEARDHACQGRLVVAGYVYPQPENVKPGDWHASGHVCVVAPVNKLGYSPSWKQNVCYVANVGSKNFYNRKMSYAYKASQKPDLFVFKGVSS